MGWKSSIQLTRKEAIIAIITALEETPYDNMSNEELENLMYELNIGDDEKLPYYGYNFMVMTNEEDIDPELHVNINFYKE
jgi:hypothetical protein